MALFNTPETHAANPPSTWGVIKVHPRRWDVTTNDGTNLISHNTRKSALAECDPDGDGFYVTLYAKESRWYAGETIPTWRPWSNILAARKRNARHWAAHSN